MMGQLSSNDVRIEAFGEDAGESRKDECGDGFPAEMSRKDPLEGLEEIPA